MTYRLALLAVNSTGVRLFCLPWTARVNARSRYDVRAWLGAHAANLAAMLEPGETEFLLAVRDADGRPLGALIVPREWPHKATGRLQRSTKTTRKKEKRP